MNDYDRVPESSASSHEPSTDVPELSTDGTHGHPSVIEAVHKRFVKDDLAAKLSKVVDKVIPRQKTMQSLRYLYRIGLGPSSSHTMGPRNAAEKFHKRHPEIKSVVCELCGSLSLTGRGHFTDVAIKSYYEMHDIPCRVDFTDKKLDYHTNGMIFRGYNARAPEEGFEVATYVCFSVGGGQIVDQAPGNTEVDKYPVYPVSSMRRVLRQCRSEGLSLDEYIFKREAEFDEMLKGEEDFVPFSAYLERVLDTMLRAIERGLKTSGPPSSDILPGELKYRRRAPRLYRKSLLLSSTMRARITPSIYAMAVGEENAAMGEVVTAPTCGSSGVIPAVIRYLMEALPEVATRDQLVKGLAVAGLIGNLAKANASISGATLGCQAEIGVACSMGAALAAFVEGGSSETIERAAEIGLEHNLGLTCDPVNGYVIVPCIQRNGINADKALLCADIALLGTYDSVISLDNCIEAMRITGLAMLDDYKETAIGGLAHIFRDTQHGKELQDTSRFESFLKRFLHNEKQQRIESLGIDPSKAPEKLYIPLDNCDVPEQKKGRFTSIEELLAAIAESEDEGLDIIEE